MGLGRTAERQPSLYRAASPPLGSRAGSGYKNRQPALAG